MKQGNKNAREWLFGMKAHVATDRRGRAHTQVTTHVGAADISQQPQPLHGGERELYGDQAYWSEMHRMAAQAQGVRYRVSRRPAPGRRLTEHQRRLKRLLSATRARGEHAFRVVKKLWGYSEVRYRGLAKNTAQLSTMFALANLHLVRQRLLPPRETCPC